ADHLPLRVKGDAARLRQISASLLAHAIKFSVTGNVFVDVVYVDDDDEGELQIVISDSSDNRSDDTRIDGDDVRLQEAEQTGRVGIGLAISKGLAECMGGSVHMRKASSGGNRMVINVPVQSISHQGKKLGADQRLKGKQVLLVDLPDRVAMDIVDELKNWGMQALPVYGYQQAVDKVTDLQAQSQEVDMVVIYNRLNSFDALALSRELATQTNTQNILQLLAMSILQRDTDEVHEHLQRFAQVTCIEKPIMYKQLYDVFCERLLGDDLENPTFSEDSDDVDIADEKPVSWRVLVVESHRVNQMVASGMLKKLDCLVYIVATGAEAVAAIDKDKFDLVLLDSDLSDEATRETIEKIRTQEKNANTRTSLPVVAMTQHLNEAEYTQLLSMGFNDYLDKPLRFDDLESRLNRWLEKD
ncbi:MAG TPA: response regulator, partial [Cellvibrionaceae bacterium]